MTIPMPEPIYEVGDYPSNGEVMCDCYSLEQLEAYADARVREALEKAESILRGSANVCKNLALKELLSAHADAIGELIPPLPGPVEPTT